MKKLATKVALVGLLTAAAAGALPTSAEAASKCVGPSGGWTCYSTTTSPSYTTSVQRSWSLKNTTKKTINAKCSVTTSASYSSSSSQSVTASVKAELFGVAEASVSGTQTFTDTLTTSEATALEFTFKLGPNESRVCQLTHGFYKVGTKVEYWSNYKVTSTKTGSTTVPYRWGLQLA